MPNALAVLRLTISLSVDNSSTGKSLTFAPFPSAIGILAATSLTLFQIDPVGNEGADRRSVRRYDGQLVVDGECCYLLARDRRRGTT